MRSITVTQSVNGSGLAKKKEKTGPMKTANQTLLESEEWVFSSFFSPTGYELWKWHVIGWDPCRDLP